MGPTEINGIKIDTPESVCDLVYSKSSFPSHENTIMCAVPPWSSLLLFQPWSDSWSGEKSEQSCSGLAKFTNGLSFFMKFLSGLFHLWVYLGFIQHSAWSSSSSSIPSLRGSLEHHRWFCNQFSPFFPVLHCPLRLAELQACPFHDVVFQSLPPSALSSSPFHCALQDGFGQTWWTGNMTMPMHRFTIIRRSSCGPIACWILARTS